jgi:hypothetical protein
MLNSISSFGSSGRRSLPSCAHRRGRWATLSPSCMVRFSLLEGAGNADDVAGPGALELLSRFDLKGDVERVARLAAARRH